MKKIPSFILSLFLLTAVLPTTVLPAYASTQDIPFTISNRFSVTNIGVPGIIDDFSEGIISVLRGNIVSYLIDYRGNIIANVNFLSLGQFHDGLAPAQVELNDKYGYIDKTGQFIIMPTFDTATDFNNGRAIVSIGEQFGIIDTAGNFVVHFDKGKYDAGQFVGGVACFTKYINSGPEQTNTFTDANGNIIASGDNIIYYDPIDGSMVKAIYTKEEPPNHLLITHLDHYVVVDKNNEQIFALNKGFSFDTYFGKDGIALIENPWTDELKTVNKKGYIIASVQGRGYLQIQKMSDKNSKDSALWVASASGNGTYDSIEFFDEHFNTVAQISTYNINAHDGMALFCTSFGKCYIIQDRDYVPDNIITFNGTPIEFDQPPIIENGRTLVPLRAIFETIGATVVWDGATQTITATLDDTTITLQVGNIVMTKNGHDSSIDVPPEIINGRTLVPVRAIAESFGATVNWDGYRQAVSISN